MGYCEVCVIIIKLGSGVIWRSEVNYGGVTCLTPRVGASSAPWSPIDGILHSESPSRMQSTTNTRQRLHWLFVTSSRAHCHQHWSRPCVKASTRKTNYRWKLISQLAGWRMQLTCPGCKPSCTLVTKTGSMSRCVLHTSNNTA